jgi:type IV secretion system protein VirB9
MYSLRFVYPLPESTDELAAAAIALEAQFRGTEVNGRRNTDYWYCGHPSIQPVSAFDDGVHTHFRFSAVAELPAIFVLNDDGGESLLNFHVENGEIVIHRIARRFVLRRGTATGCVVNGSFGGSGRRLDSGTVTPTVQRKTIGDGR